MSSAVTVRVALFTVCPPLRVPVLPEKLESPLYTAVMVWLPAVRDVVAKVAVAVPPLPLSVPEPIVTPPSLKSTVPDGVFEPPDLVTVAVKVTESPYVEGLPEVATVVVVPGKE